MKSSSQVPALIYCACMSALLQACAAQLQCPAGAFDCNKDGSECVPLEAVRDCKPTPDCRNGADEDCPAGTTRCEDEANLCGRCVPNAILNTTCIDRFYKRVCRAFPNETFQCATTTNCVHKTWVLDGDNDCFDFSDENPCYVGTANCSKFATCSFNNASLTYTCSCNKFYYGDGKVCTNYISERLSGSCASGFYDCGSTCVPIAKFRDCVADCPLSVDEDCWPGEVSCAGACKCGLRAFENATCNATAAFERCVKERKFACASGECINDNLVLDGKPDCADGSDENGCVTPPFNTCPANSPCSYIPISHSFSCGCPVGLERSALGVCGDMRRLNPCTLGTHTCSKNAACTFDQATQNYTCTCSEFYYGDGRNCLHNVTARIPGTCKAGYYDCGSGTCIPLPKFRNCASNCIGDVDEDCWPGETRCGPSDCKCGMNGFLNQTCSGLAIFETCARQGLFSCLTGNQCIPDELVLDGKRDCADNSDESMCQMSPFTQCTSPCSYVPLSHSFYCGCPPNMVRSPQGICGSRRVTNPCEQGTSQCSPFATCNFNSSIQDYTCTCLPYYSGDGMSCTNDIGGRIPGNCSVGSFDCGNGTCIAVRKFRDCVADCPGGIDEECWPGEVKCGSSCQCALSFQLLNQTCTRLEEFETCSKQGLFTCARGSQCIAVTLVLDGKPDCVDGSDETICQSAPYNACPPSRPCSFVALSKSFSCGCPTGFARSAQGICADTRVSNPCTLGTNTCDRHASCNVDQPTASTYTCRCLDFYYGNGSMCTHNITARLEGNCPAGMYACGNGTCIPVSKFRDCAVDCGDSSDEECWANEMRCPNSCTCFPKELTSQSCVNGTTFDSCARQGRFSCGSQCISADLVLDGKQDCQDGSDEYACFMAPLNLCSADAPCSYIPLSRTFSCGCPPGLTRSTAGVCSQLQIGDPNNPCTNGNNTCSVNAICLFDNATRIYSCTCKEYYVGDGRVCRHNITARFPGKCGPGMFDCGASRCVSASKFRNCVPDCPGSVDEDCWSSESKCNRTCACAPMTLSSTEVCGRSSDFERCAREGKFSCGGQCISDDLVLDGTADCVDDSDETACQTGPFSQCPSATPCSFVPVAHSFACGCPEGFRRTTRGTCVDPVTFDLNACQNGRHNCSKDALCSFDMQTQRFSCTCRKYFVGNGTFCSPNATAHLPGACTSNRFDCGNGKCITIDKLRNCIPDCYGGIDETCWPWEKPAPCNSSCSCLPLSYETLPCAKLAQFEACAKQGMFACLSDGKCIADTLVLNGNADCGDETDEISCRQAPLNSCPTTTPCSYIPWSHSFACGCPDGMSRTTTGVCFVNNTNVPLNITGRNPYPGDCAEVQINNPLGLSGLYTVFTPSCLNPERCSKEVYCDFDTEGGGYTVIQRRLDGSLNFNQDWNTYKRGFGAVEAEFWIGNDYLYALSSRANTTYELLVLLTTLSNVLVTARYDSFHIDDESQNYRLRLGNFVSGEADNYLHSRNQNFGTRDLDTDSINDVTCGTWWQSGWWHASDCSFTGNLNVPYKPVGMPYAHLAGIVWPTIVHESRIRTTQMKVRPRGFVRPTLPAPTNVSPTSEGQRPPLHNSAKSLRVWIISFFYIHLFNIQSISVGFLCSFRECFDRWHDYLVQLLL